MKKGDIYLVNFDPSLGAEYKKTRPSLVIQSEAITSNLITVMPISSKIDKQMADDILLGKNPKNRLFSDSIIKVQQISSFDPQRFVHFIGSIDQRILKKVEVYLRKHFGIDYT